MAENSTMITMCMERIGQGPERITGRAIFYDMSGRSECIISVRGRVFEGHADDRTAVEGRCRKAILRAGLNHYPTEVVDNTGLSADKESIAC